MNNGILFFEPIPRKTLWGGTAVKNYFNYPAMEVGVGQAWAFADQPGGLSNTCVTSPFTGLALHDIWKGHPELFESKYEVFPFIISLVAPEDDLSIQVHPDSKTAINYGFDTGKDEAWYFLEVSDSSLIYGHNAKSKQQLLHHIKNHQFDGLFRTIPAIKDSFIYLPAGMIHALGRGNIVYEIQQSTDLTWRIYDYARKGNDGVVRELHLDKALEVLENVSDESLGQAISNVTKQTISEDDFELSVYRSDSVFTVTRFICHGQGALTKDSYWLCTVVQGSGYINNIEVAVGDNFIITAACQRLSFSGEFMVMITSEK